MSHSDNIERIKAVNQALGDLKDKVVYVGGATVSLYADRETTEVRPTEDIDIVVELWHYSKYAELEEQLRKIGFVNDMESKVICRYKIHGITVDIMPTDGSVLGFKNHWYPDGYKHAIDCQIDESHSVKIFTAPYFLATKIDAFKDRGGNDGRMSTDFEDIVFLLENRRALWQELSEAPSELKDYLKNEFKQLLANPYFVNG